MKKLGVIIAAIIFFALATNAQTKSGSNYFEGKWNVLVKGLPQGDTKMIVDLQKLDTTLTGTIQDSTGTEISKFTKVEVSDNKLKVYFTSQGYEVNLAMDKKDDDHITGSMMSMFDAEGERIKNIK